MEERLKNIEMSLISTVETQMEDLSCVNAKELEIAIDIIKDIEEAIYYNHLSLKNV